MTGTALEPRPSTEIGRPTPTPWTAIPVRQARWVGVQALVAAGLATAGAWAASPSLALAVALGAGVAVIEPRRLWAAPLVVGSVASAALLASAVGVPAILVAGAVAGAIAARLQPEPSDWLDTINGTLAGAATASLGLWTAVQLVPDAVGSVFGAVLAAGLVGLVSAQTLVPLALRFDKPELPSARALRRELTQPYRKPVVSALQVFFACRRADPDDDTLWGLAEVVRWVFRLQVTLQTLDRELQVVSPDEVRSRIEGLERSETEDKFTRERQQATVRHLERLLEHRKALDVERTRTAALVEYALAYLDEARIGLALARELPGEATPDRLHEVLRRLRHHAAAGDARRATNRELTA